MFVIHSVSNTGPRPQQNRNNSYQEVETQLKRELEEARLNLTNMQRQQTRYQEAEAQLKIELEEAHLDLTNLTPTICLQLDPFCGLVKLDGRSICRCCADAYRCPAREKVDVHR